MPDNKPARKYEEFQMNFLLKNWKKKTYSRKESNCVPACGSASVRFGTGYHPDVNSRECLFLLMEIETETERKWKNIYSLFSFGSAKVLQNVGKIRDVSNKY
jgi:hypothetical protein